MASEQFEITCVSRFRRWGRIAAYISQNPDADDACKGLQAVSDRRSTPDIEGVTVSYGVNLEYGFRSLYWYFQRKDHPSRIALYAYSDDPGKEPDKLDFDPSWSVVTDADEDWWLDWFDHVEAAMKTFPMIADVLSRPGVDEDEFNRWAQKTGIQDLSDMTDTEKVVFKMRWS